MESGSKALAAITAIITALITAAATIGASYVNLLKPTEKQIVNSAQYKNLVDESAEKTIQIGELRQRLSSLESDNRKLTQAINETKAGMAHKQQSPSTPVVPTVDLPSRVESTPTELRSVPSETATLDAGPLATTLAPKSRRTELQLAMGPASKIRDDLTITLARVQSDGVDLVINGQKANNLKVGQRTRLLRTSRETCFLEIMSYSPNQEGQATARADMMCEPR